MARFGVVKRGAGKMRRSHGSSEPQSSDDAQSGESARPGARHSTSQEVLDSFRVPLILLDRRRKIVHANPAAARLMAEARLIEAVDGRLGCPQPENHAELCAVLDHLFDDIDAADPDAPRKRRVLALLHEDGHRVPAIVLSLRRRSAGPADSTHRALLSIVQTLGTMPELPVIERTFGLTPAEARLAALIATGSSPTVCARELNVKISTVRSQLNAVYRKTGAKGQSQLVALILSLTIF